MAYLFGSIWDRTNRNALNNLSKSVEQHGKSIQDLVAEGQLTPTQYAQLIQSVNGMVKSGQIDISDLSLNLKTELDEFGSQLADKAEQSEVNQKRDKSIPITSLDVSDELIQMFSPAGTVSPVLEKSSVSYDKTTFLVPKKNLFNKELRTLNNYTRSTDGKLVRTTNYDSTDFIPVESGQPYVLSHTGQWAEYDASKIFIAGHTSSVKTAVLNSATKFIRSSVRKEEVDTFQIEKGSVSTLYEPFTLNFSKTTKEPIQVVEDESVSPKQTTFMGPETGKNKFLDYVILRDIIPSTTKVSRGVGGVSFLLPCKKNVPHTISRQVVGTRFRAAYTTTDILVTGETPALNTTLNDSGTSVILPANPDAEFIICYFWVGEFTEDDLAATKIQVEETTGATSYEEPFKTFKLKKEFIPSVASGEGEKTTGIFSVLSDSIGTFEGWMPEGNRSRYPVSFMSEVNLTWWKRLADETGLELGVNDSWAGSRVTWDGVTEGQDVGVDKHMASSARINKLGNNGNPDYIFFAGGTNDARGGLSLGEFDKNDLTSMEVKFFKEAYRTAIIKMQTTYPNAKIVCMTPMYARESTQYTNSALESYVEAIREIAEFLGCIFIDMRKCGITAFNKESHLGDGLHPNPSGFNLMVKHLIKELQLS